MGSEKIVIGALAGAGLAFSSVLLYKQNKKRIDAFLRAQGIDMPSTAEADYSTMGLKELVATKERLEDIIAEKEFAAQQAAAEQEASGPEAEPPGEGQG
jgi:hypothetical protein